jgi:TIR domain
MKVFISWSGERSKAVAEALRYWLPKVIQALEPWMSANDIEKGTRWRSGIASELEQSSVGIICLTRENLDSPWIHFEAGALSKQQEKTYVCTLLFGLEPTDVREPLAQFQHTRATKEDLRKLISTINNTLGDLKLSESELSETFDVWWPKLEERLSKIGEETAETAPIRSDRELLEEVLNIVRTKQAERDAQVEAIFRTKLVQKLEELQDRLTLASHRHEQDFRFLKQQARIKSDGEIKESSQYENPNS